MIKVAFRQGYGSPIAQLKASASFCSERKAHIAVGLENAHDRDWTAWTRVFPVSWCGPASTYSHTRGGRSHAHGTEAGPGSGSPETAPPALLSVRITVLCRP